MKINLIPSEFQKRMIDAHAARRAANELVQITPRIPTSTIDCISFICFIPCRISLQMAEEDPQAFEWAKRQQCYQLDKWAEDHGSVGRDTRHVYVQKWRYADVEPCTKEEKDQGYRSFFTAARYWFPKDCKDPVFLEETERRDGKR